MLYSNLSTASWSVVESNTLSCRSLIHSLRPGNMSWIAPGSEWLISRRGELRNLTSCRSAYSGEICINPLERNWIATI
ncbi:hypothetical protein NPIL_599301 [Nephila pilipes]|uniref:Uncharacterized protein n=1 Tax=Nephila pilipes TaxID=299642 RepID=A0A8X6U2Z0_NEPPI|nr:hypothetical protein NPIL_599301 [Nephila pilipes]